MGGVTTSPQFGDPRLPQRFWNKVKVNGRTGCWLWTAAVNKAGYGLINVGGGPKLAHRHAYEVLVGEIPPPQNGQPWTILNHECYVHSCVNPGPGHACQPMTIGKNTRHAADRRTACRKGHPFTEANTIWQTSTARTCRTCRNDWWIRWRAARRGSKSERLES